MYMYKTKMASKREIWEEIRQAHREHDEECDGYGYVSEEQDQMLNAVVSNNIDGLQQLLSQGVDPSFADDEGKSPLHIVCEKSSDQNVGGMLELLVYFGAALDVCDRFGALPIHTAVGTSGDHVRLLLDAGSPIDRQDNAGRTPLMLACMGDCSEALTIVQYLLDRNANVILTDVDGYTALHYLCRYGRHHETVRNEIVYKLLYAGLPADVTDNRGVMAVCYEIDRISRHRNEQQLLVVQLLIQSGSKLDVSNKGHERIVKTWMIEVNSSLITELLDIAELGLSLKTVKALYRFCGETPDDSVLNKIDGVRKRLYLLSRTVRSLKLLCCQAVRQELGGQILKKAELLPIPTSLQKNLLLQV